MTMRKSSKILLVAVVAGSMVALGGCAAPAKELDVDIKSMVEDALSRARVAEQTAADAKATADRALAAAEAADACCRDNRSRIDRIFEKAVEK